jgi:hypothetical protein
VNAIQSLFSIRPIEGRETTQTLWNQMKGMLLGQSSQEVAARKTIARFAAYAETTAMLGASVCGITFAVTALALRSVTIAAIGALAYTIAHDLSVIGHNVEKITTDRGRTNNLVQRALVAASIDRFVQTCFQDTWIADIALKNVIIHELLRTPPKINLLQVVHSLEKQGPF